MALPLRRVVFLCVANSARSQLAEALARHHLPSDWTFQSAGSRPTRVNPFAIQALDEIGVSAQGLSSTAVESIDPTSVDAVIALCAEEECPVFLGDVPRLSWAQPDPDRKHEDLTDAQRLEFFRIAREAIQERVLQMKAGVVEEIHVDHLWFRFNDTGFMDYDHRDMPEVDLETAHSTVQHLQQLIAERNWPQPTGLIVDLTDVKRIDREARALFANTAVTGDPDSRIALLAPTRVARVMGNFFLRIQNTGDRIQMFSSRASAVEFLARR